MTRVLVPTALGNVGQSLVRMCPAHGLEVRAAHRDMAVAAERLPATEIVQLDFLRRETWKPALHGCDAVFLLRPPAISDMKATLIPFVDAAYEIGVKHIVFVSVAGADRMAWVPHRKVELHLARSGMAWTVLRPGFFAQNLQDAYQRDIREDDRLYVPAGWGEVAFIDAVDIAAVAARVLQEPEAYRGQSLLLTGPEALRFDEVADLLSSTLGRAIRYQPASIPGYLWHLRRRRQLAWAPVIVQTILHVGLRRGDAASVDPTIEAILGRPARKLGDYVRDAAASWAR